MANKHWGEIYSKMEDSPPDVSADIERSMSSIFLNEFNIDSESLEKIEVVNVKISNPYITYAIALHKHLNLLEDLINQKKACKAGQVYIKPDDADLEIPEMPENLTKPRLGDENAIPDLSKAVVRQILRKSIATMLAQIGYESSQESCIDVFNDVVDAFYKKIGHSLKTAIDYDEKQYSRGFPHPVERVLTESGLGGVKGVSEYYNKQVVNYVTILRERCIQMTEQYKSLLHENVKVENNESIVSNPQAVHRSNNEVHISASDVHQVHLPILQAGYELLNSFEAVTNFN